MDSTRTFYIFIHVYPYKSCLSGSNFVALLSAGHRPAVMKILPFRQNSTSKKI
jgi:hypothetical protein